MRFSKLTFAALTAAAIAQNTTVPTLLAALNATSDLSSLNSLVLSLPTATQQTLAGLTDVTILAPNNAAFANFRPASNTTEALTGVLLYHVLPGVYENFTEAAQILRTSLTSQTAGNFTTLTNQVVEAVNINGTNTIYGGFKKNVTTSGGPVNFTGGVIHVIGEVLSVPGTPGNTAIELSLSSLVGLLNRTSLVTPLNSAEQLTIFAPSNAAFQAIGSLINSQNVTTEALASILQYHVISGSVLYSTNLTNTSVTTLSNTTVNVQVFNSSDVFVNNARVVTPDVFLSNGVLHVIDQVLNPLNATATGNSSSGAGSPAFSGATDSGEPPATSNVPSPTGSGAPSGGANPTSAAPTSSGAAWRMMPTGIPVAMLAGAVLAL